MNYTDKLIEEYLKEAPDMYGLFTDDEYDKKLEQDLADLEAEYKENKEAALRQHARNKEETNKRRNILTSNDERLGAERLAFNKANNSKTDLLYNDIINGIILDRSIKIDFNNNIEKVELKRNDEGQPFIEIELKPNGANLYQYWVFLRPCSIWTPMVYNGKGHNLGNSEIEPRTNEIIKGINIISDNLDTIISQIYNAAKVQTNAALKRFGDLFVDPMKLTAIMDTENPGHWAWGGKFMRFSYNGKVYEYEEYDSGAYSGNHCREIRKFTQIYPITGEDIKKINPTSVGLNVTPPARLSREKITGGKIDVTKLK